MLLVLLIQDIVTDMHVIIDEFPDVQFFITTHDYVWFEEYVLFKSVRQEHKFKNLQILDWSLEDGPRLDKYKPAGRESERVRKCRQRWCSWRYEKRIGSLFAGGIICLMTQSH